MTKQENTYNHTLENTTSGIHQHSWNFVWNLKLGLLDLASIIKQEQGCNTLTVTSITIVPFNFDLNWIREIFHDVSLLYVFIKKMISCKSSLDANEAYWCKHSHQLHHQELSVLLLLLMGYWLVFLFSPFCLLTLTSLILKYPLNIWKDSILVQT